eukprot:2945280-Prymnesium_polylepis.1
MDPRSNARKTRQTVRTHAGHHERIFELLHAQLCLACPCVRLCLRCRTPGDQRASYCTVCRSITLSPHTSSGLPRRSSYDASRLSLSPASSRRIFAS